MGSRSGKSWRSRACRGKRCWRSRLEGMF
jgi:hypothetical protein